MDTTSVPYRITLRSGQRVLVRALRPDDGPGLAEAFEQLSETSRYRRFFTVKPHLSEPSLAYFTNVDHHDHEALVAVASGSGQLVGVARFIRDPREPDQAEVAVTVIDSWQRRGLGTILLRELAQRGAEEGLRSFTAEILAENQPMLTLAQRLGDAESTLDGTTVSTRIELLAAPRQAATFRSDGYDLLRAAARGEFIGVPAVLRGWLNLTEMLRLGLEDVFGGHAGGVPGGGGGFGGLVVDGDRAGLDDAMGSPGRRCRSSTHSTSTG